MLLFSMDLFESVCQIWLKITFLVLHCSYKNHMSDPITWPSIFVKSKSITAMLYFIYFVNQLDISGTAPVSILGHSPRAIIPNISFWRFTDAAPNFNLWSTLFSTSMLTDNAWMMRCKINEVWQTAPKYHRNFTKNYHFPDNRA